MKFPILRVPALLALLPATLLISWPAHALTLPNGVSVLRADDLQNRCITAAVMVNKPPPGTAFTDQDRMAAEDCSAYFSAFNEMLMAMRDGGVTPLGICYPAQPRPAIDFIKIFIAFVEQHPEAKASPAMPVALAAAAEALPCNTGPRPK